MAETYKPTQGMIEEAKRALKWIADGKAGQGFTDTGRKRASDLAAGRVLSAETVKRMYSFFARHEVDKKALGFNAGEDGFPSAGRVAWSAWGGDAGFSWSSKIRNQLQDEEKMSKVNTDTAVYAAILKMDEQPDGSLLVHGKATDDTLDSDEQVCDPTWLASAMPEWFKYGNIREQHSSVAAGVATEYKAEGSEHFITAHVVDAGSVAKVKAGVLKGFSIGIRKPRIAKDNKALGGRIVDGQIVEISLVDRPANPACTLTMAKTINSELVQVEELAELETVIETSIETEGVTVKEITATSIIESAKSFVGDLNKFDQAAFDTARTALATLIQVEAGEMAEGSDEIYSIACLLNAVHALLEWHEGEAAEGETEPLAEIDEMVEMSTEPETVKDDSVEMCDKCDKEMKECKCAEGGYSDTEIKSDEADVVAEVAVEVTDEPAIESADETVEVEEKALTVSDVQQIVADIVKTLLTPTEVGEDTVTKSIEAERIEALESELEQVKALAAPSSVKRMGAVGSTSTVDENLVKAANFRAKANATNDRTLARGYIEMARELETKSN
jgi:hypothetical protein